MLLLIAREKPALRSEIVEVPCNADMGICGYCMRSLVCEDISDALLEIEDMP